MKKAKWQMRNCLKYIVQVTDRRRFGGWSERASSNNRDIAYRKALALVAKTGRRVRIHGAVGERLDELWLIDGKLVTRSWPESEKIPKEI